MRRREGVVDVDVAELRQRLRETAVVLLLAGVEAGVLEQKDIAFLHGRDRLRRRFADAILGEGHRAPEHVRQGCSDRLQGLLRVAPLRPAEMGQEDDLAALVGDLLDGRDHALEAGPVGDAPVLHRHVEVDADEDALALQIGAVERAHAHPRQAPQAGISAPRARTRR